jgi:transcription initiation factor TFIID subunit TAF12
MHMQALFQMLQTFILQILTRPRLQDLVREVDPTEQLDEEVEELLLQLADDFVESTVGAACLLAKHRKASTVEIKDVQLHLGKLGSSYFIAIWRSKNCVL